MQVVLLLLACGAANAQVIECPPAHPLEPTALASDRKTIVKRARLTSGRVDVGDLILAAAVALQLQWQLSPQLEIT